MRSNAHPMTDSPTNARLFWFVVALLGVVFFFLEHHVLISRYEAFTPWAEAAGSQENGRNALKGLALACVGLFGAGLAVRPIGRPLRFGGWLSAMVLCYVGWLVASVTWSIDPGMSCRRLFALSCCLAAAVGLSRRFGPRDVARLAVLVGGTYAVVGVVAELALGTFRPWMAEYRFAGTIHPNAQGVLLATACLAAFCLARTAPRHGRWLWACFAVGLILLMLTKSRASCACLAAGLALVWLAEASSRARAMAVLAAGLMLSAVAIVSAFGNDALGDRLLGAVMLGRQEESEGLSGRVPLWEELWRYVQARPLQGYGYQAFWTDKHIAEISDDMEWALREAHNGFLETLLSVGAVGGVILLAVMAAGLCRAWVGCRAEGDGGMAFLLGLLAFCLTDAWFESGVPNFTAVLAEIGLVQLMILRVGEGRTPRPSMGTCECGPTCRRPLAVDA